MSFADRNKLDRYQGRDSYSGHGPMFSEGFRAGSTRAEDIPLHFVRIWGRGDSHEVQPGTKTGPGLDCTLCMATAARGRQEIEGWRLGWDDMPLHER